MFGLKIRLSDSSRPSSEQRACIPLCLLVLMTPQLVWRQHCCWSFHSLPRGTANVVDLCCQNASDIFLLHNIFCCFFQNCIIQLSKFLWFTLISEYLTFKSQIMIVYLLTTNEVLVILVHSTPGCLVGSSHPYYFYVWSRQRFGYPCWCGNFHAIATEVVSVIGNRHTPSGSSWFQVKWLSL